MSNDLTKYYDYDHYLSDWLPPLDARTEKELTPLTRKEFHELRDEEIFEDERKMEEYFGHLEPLDITQTIDLISKLEG